MRVLRPKDPMNWRLAFPCCCRMKIAKYLIDMIWNILMNFIKIQGIVIGKRVKYRLIGWRTKYKRRIKNRSFICRKLRRMC